MKKLIPFLIALWLSPVLLGAQQRNKPSRAVLESRKQALLKEIEAANKSLLLIKKSTRQNINVQQALLHKIASRTALINDINQEISMIEGDISYTNSNVQTLKKEVDSLRARYAQLVVYAYKTKNSYDVLSFFFTANNFNNALRRFKYLQEYRANRRRQAENLLSTKALLGEKLAALQLQRAQKNDVLQVEQQQRTSLLKNKKETDLTIEQLKDQEQELQQRINKSKAAAKQVDLAIQAAIRREMVAAQKRANALALARKRDAAVRHREWLAARKRAALAATKKINNKIIKPNIVTNNMEKEEDPPAKTGREDVLTATPEALSLSRDFEANQGHLPWPVAAGRISGHFGASRIGKIEVDHNGILITTNKGATVTAIFNGAVIMVFLVPGAGYMVTLRHGKYFTNYVKLLDVRVAKGEVVKRGQVLGIAASEPGSNHGEIELQIYRNMMKQNPEKWIRAR